MADCRYCGVANDDDSRELYICESCRSQRSWEEKVCFNNYCPKLHVCKISAFNTLSAQNKYVARVNHLRDCMPDYKLFQPCPTCGPLRKELRGEGE